MSLWFVFTAVGSALFGTVAWTAAAWPADRSGATRPPVSEAKAWWRLVRPLFAGVLAVAFLVGWAVQEPDPADEWVAFEMCLMAGLVGAVAVRAFLRAVRSLCAGRRGHAPIATVGLLRCRTVVADAFARAASAEALAAALAHEAAHARARDPGRIWLAQLAADLQWPIPRARRRFGDWLLALEMRRDDEAVAGGASPTALAEAILLAAKLQVGPASRSGAAITGRGEGLAIRVRRLLADRAGNREVLCRRAPWIAASCCAAIGLAVVLGAACGDSLLLLLPGVGR